MKFEYPQEVIVIEKALTKFVENAQRSLRLGVRSKEEIEILENDLVLAEEMLKRIQTVKQG